MMIPQSRLILLLITAPFVLAACSYFKSGTPEAPTKQKNAYWNYQKSWQYDDLPADLAGITAGKVTIKGQCSFSATLMKTGLNTHRSVLMPFLDFSPDGTLSPDFDLSAPLYKELQTLLDMAPATDSLQVYQRWVSSLEHACPDNGSREISQCSLKSLYSMKLWGGEELYNFDRLNYWLEQQDNIGIILFPHFSLLSSKAVLNLKYSPHSAPVIRQSDAERLAAVSPHLGRQSIDWVKLNNDGLLKGDLVSSGRCSIVWQELDSLRGQNRVSGLTAQKLNQIDQALAPVLLSFMNGALQQVKK